MAFTEEDVRANRDYFAAKLRAEKQRADLVRAVESGKREFILIDTRGAGPFAAGHLPGAWCVDAADLDRALPSLPKDRELVLYCWSHD